MVEQHCDDVLLDCSGVIPAVRDAESEDFGSYSFTTRVVVDDCDDIDDDLPKCSGVIGVVSDAESEDYASDSFATQIVDDDDDDDDDLTTDGHRGCEVQEQNVPTFGNVSVNNSTGVQFGNNTFFHGPVTIQNFVYANSSLQDSVKDALPEGVKAELPSASPCYSQFNHHPITTKDSEGQLKRCVGRATRHRQCVALLMAATVAVLVTTLTFSVIYFNRDSGVDTEDPSAGQEFDTDAQADANYTEFQAEPRRLVAKSGDSITILGKAGGPISICYFYLPQPRRTFLDFSLGSKSLSTARYEYYGRGLDKGECGIKYKEVDDQDDGIVECQVTMKATNKGRNSVTTLRVTELPVSDLPVFEIVPRAANLRAGDNLTVTCNADREINMCHIYLPGPRLLDFDRGQESDQSSAFRYLGTSLKDGHCGVTMTDVDTRLNGFVVCKIGQWPESVVGAWETDALKVSTKYVAGVKKSENSTLSGVPSP